MIAATNSAERSRAGGSVGSLRLERLICVVVGLDLYEFERRGAVEKRPDARQLPDLSTIIRVKRPPLAARAFGAHANCRRNPRQRIGPRNLISSGRTAPAPSG